MKEEWQNPDSGYLNCIGVGDTYVKKQMERILNESVKIDVKEQMTRILNENVIKMESLCYDIKYGRPITVCANDLEFEEKDK